MENIKYNYYEYDESNWFDGAYMLEQYAPHGDPEGGYICAEEELADAKKRMIQKSNNSPLGIRNVRVFQLIEVFPGKFQKVMKEDWRK